jgi:site-specific recombinase XerD
MANEIVLVREGLEQTREAKQFPVLIEKAGEKAKYKFLEFFMATLSNENTRESYARAAYRFLSWCETKGLELSTIHPVAAAAYFQKLEQEVSVASVKQHLSALKHMFDFFVTEGVSPFNPVASVKGPKYSPKHGKTPHLTPEETRALFESVEGEGLKDARDLAMLSVLFYAWVRVSALCKLNVGDYRRVGDRYTLRFKEKGGKVHELPVHHKAIKFLERYLKEAGIDPDDKSQQKKPLFRTIDRTRTLTTTRVDRNDVLRMVKTRALEAGLTTHISVHTARATGITTFLENQGRLEQAQDIANQADPRTTRLYDRRRDRIERAEIERVQY